MTTGDVIAVVQVIVLALLFGISCFVYNATNSENKRGIAALLICTMGVFLLFSTASLLDRDWGPQPKPLTREDLCLFNPAVCPTEADIDRIVDEIIREMQQEGR